MMDGEELKYLDFVERLEEIKESMGSGNQEAIKMALKECQETFSYVSVASQKQIAEVFEVEEKIVKTMIKFIPAIKESLVTYDIVVCTGKRCANNGSLEVIRELKKLLQIDIGKTTKDGKIRLTSKNCFKKCNLGPNIMINGKFYHNMNKEKVKELVESIK